MHSTMDDASVVMGIPPTEIQADPSRLRRSLEEARIRIDVARERYMESLCVPLPRAWIVNACIGQRQDGTTHQQMNAGPSLQDG